MGWVVKGEIVIGRRYELGMYLRGNSRRFAVFREQSYLGGKKEHPE